MEEQKIQIENEINLMDYVKVILKRKWLILSIFLLAIISAGIFSFISPRIYRIDTLLEIGRAKGVIIEEPGQVIEKIERDVYGILAREKLGIPIQEYPEIKAENLAGTTLIRMIIESSDPQKAKTILREINKIILAEHQEKLAIKKQTIENEIEITKNKISVIENNIERIKAKIKHTKKEEKSLEAKIETLQQILVYKQTPGTQFALFNTKEKLASKRRERENLYLSINSLEIQLKNLNLTINSLKASLDDIIPTKVIRIPIASVSPIKPKPLLNIAIAGILGLFMGTFLAFGKEWWMKSR